MQQPMASIDIESPPGELSVDSTEALKALGKGPHLAWMNSIYSQIPSLFLQGLAKTVEEGNRMAQLTNPRNPFAELAASSFQSGNQINYLGEASIDNVRVRYQAHKPIINIEAQKPQIDYTPFKTEFTYTRGSVEVYLTQRNSVEFHVGEYDQYI